MPAYTVPACITLELTIPERIGLLVMRGATPDHANLGTYAPTQFFVSGVTEEDQAVPLYAWRRDISHYAYGVPYTWHHPPNASPFWSIEVPIGFCLQSLMPLKTLRIRVDHTGPGHSLDETIAFDLYSVTDQPVCIRASAQSTINQASAYQEALQKALQMARQELLTVYNCRKWHMHAREKTLSYRCPDNTPATAHPVYIAHPDRAKINGLREHMRKYLIELGWNCE